LLHPQDQFHYVLGAKYFPELGYEGIYDATALATRQAGLPQPTHVRNLQSGALETADVAAKRGERLAFTPARWQAFVDDISTFHQITNNFYLGAVMDHGFNPTPAWISLARLVLGDAPITADRLYLCASIDLVLLVLLLAALVATFGLEDAALAVLLLGTSVVWRFGWVGASFLRYDWFVALGWALVCLRRRYFTLAGGLLAWSTALRLFPALFALAAGLSLVFQAGDRSGRVALARFTLGFLAIAGLALAAGTAAGRGPYAWAEYAERIRVHHSAWAENHVGLDSVAIVDAALRYRGNVGATPRETIESYVASIEATRRERRPFLSILVLASVVAVALAARHLPAWRAMPLGVIPVFCASAIAGYYWMMLVLVPFVAPRRTSIALIVTTPVVALVEIVSGSGTAAHTTVSLLYLLILTDWLLQVLRSGQSVNDHAPLVFRRRATSTATPAGSARRKRTVKSLSSR
jgi:hypothetical protein